MPELNPADEFDSLSSGPLPGLEPPSDGDGRAELTLHDQLDAARAQVEEQRDRYLRTLADFDNYRKRMQRDIRESSDRGRRDVLLRILPVLDNLVRAEEHSAGGTPPDQIVDGIILTAKQIRAALAAEKVRPIEVIGKPFDPAIAEAVATQPAPDGIADNTVIAEAATGYYLGDEVLRPAQVVVAKKM